MNIRQLQAMLDSLPPYVKIEMSRTEREGEQYGKRNIYGEKSRNHCNWIVLVVIPSPKTLDGYPIDETYIIGRMTDVLYWEEMYRDIFSTYVDSDGMPHINLLFITVESDYLKLALFRAYRAALYLLRKFGMENML